MSNNQHGVGQGAAGLGFLTSDLKFEPCEWKKSSLEDPYPLQEGL